VEGLKDYVKIFVAKEKHPILTRLNLKAIEGKLPSTEFIRIHNSFIVPLKKIKSFQKSQVFIGETAIPIGEKYAETFKKQYGQ
jgi:DNA-binding LytR/AlgR family response regulator